MSSSPSPSKPAKPLNLSAVQPGDIFLTASDTKSSSQLRTASCSKFSHAILVTHNNECIHSVPERGVVREKLHDALQNTIRAYHYRYIGMTPALASSVIYVAEMQVYKDYDYLGAARSGVNTGCTPMLRYTRLGSEIMRADERAAGGRHDRTFFCSELVAYAYERAGLRLFNSRYYEATPGAIADSSKLVLIHKMITI